MKKGSHARHCGICNKIVFWVIPNDDDIGWIRTMHLKQVCEHRYDSKRQMYICKECEQNLQQSCN